MSSVFNTVINGPDRFSHLTTMRSHTLNQFARRFVLLRNPTRIQRHFSSSSRVLADPWPLPHTPEHMASTTTPTDSPPLPPLPRPNESIETLRARLVYQSRKRGTLESDLLLSTFARDHLSGMTQVELKEYDKVCYFILFYFILKKRIYKKANYFYGEKKLLDEADWDIYYWATDMRTPPDRWVDSTLLEKLRVHARNEGKVVRKMPPL